MIYPSLLYKAESSSERIAPDVLDDLKINLLLSCKTIEAMRAICPITDILLRQAAYSDIAESLSEFEALLALAEKAESLYNFYINAESEPERDYVFIMLIQTTVSFAKLAAAVNGKSEYVSRFRSAFADECNTSDFKALEAQLAEHLPMTAKVSSATFTVRGDHLKIDRADDTDRKSVV